MKRFTTIITVLIGIMIVVATRLQNDQATKELRARFNELGQTALVGQLSGSGRGGGEMAGDMLSLPSSSLQIFYSLDHKTNDDEVVRLIDSASSTIYFAIYSFTKTNIADALIRAKQRGVVVEGITDSDQVLQGPQAVIAQKLRSAGIPYGVQKHSRGLMHIKALVTDKAYAVGSYNWTEAATSYNDEILEIGTDPSIRAQYETVVREVIAVNR